MREHVSVDGIFISSVKRWRPPEWLAILPIQLRSSRRFLVLIRRFGSYEPEQILGQTDVIDLLTNSGRDWMHGMVYTDTAASLATLGAQILALSTDAAAANATDTALAGEVTTASLARKAGACTHSAGSNTTSMVASWTAAVSTAGIVKAAACNATSTTTYTMVHEGTVTTATLQINDVYTLTVNTTLG
jgi:hypothetical protein